MVLFLIRLDAVEVAPGVQDFITKIFVNVSVKLVGAGLGHNINDCAGIAAVFGVESIRDDAEFLNTVGRRLYYWEVGELVVAVSSIDAVIVGAAAATVDGNYSRFVTAIEQI